ncbi:UbiA family prenyltransferase [Homoserinimonas sp. A447]
MSTAIALARATHPGPTVSVTIVALLIGVAADLSLLRLVILAVVILTNQASIGLSNDWLDAERDRTSGRRDKPIPLGLVRVETVRAWAVGTAMASVAVSIVLGPSATIANVAFLASAWGYNLGLKATPYSVLPYLVSFGLLPTIVTLSREEAAPAAWWAMGMGALLGAAAHFANVLPDFDDDRRTRIRGLPHRLGRAASGIVIAVALVGASVLAVVGWSDDARWFAWVGLGLTAAIAVVCAILLSRRPPTRLLFRLIILAALGNVALLVVSGDSLLA